MGGVLDEGRSLFIESCSCWLSRCSWTGSLSGNAEHCGSTLTDGALLRADGISNGRVIPEDLDAGHALDLKSPSINPQIITNHGISSQGNHFSHSGPNRQTTWSTGPTSIQHGHRAATKPLQRT